MELLWAPLFFKVNRSGGLLNGVSFSSIILAGSSKGFSLRFLVLTLAYKGRDHKKEAPPGAAEVIVILNSDMPGLDFPSMLNKTE